MRVAKRLLRQCNEKHLLVLHLAAADDRWKQYPQCVLTRAAIVVRNPVAQGYQRRRNLLALILKADYGTEVREVGGFLHADDVCCPHTVLQGDADAHPRANLPEKVRRHGIVEAMVQRKVEKDLRHAPSLCAFASSHD